MYGRNNVDSIEKKSDIHSYSQGIQTNLNCLADKRRAVLSDLRV